MYKPLVALGAAILMGTVASPAMALPGDPGIRAASFRLNERTLEPGCFPGSRIVDLDTHIRLGGPATELHITVDDGARFSVDQVLVPSLIDGYSVFNTFDTGTVNDDPDIDPGQTATGMSSPTLTIDRNDVIICVSQHGDVLQNEPYQQESGGLVSAKNRPILTPKVTAIGVSAIAGLHTFKVGLGYTATRWYAPTVFDGRNEFANVTDPNGVGDPLFGDRVPDLVDLFPRLDGNYDARRVNDVNDASQAWDFFDPFDGQTFFFKRLGDDTAWATDHIFGIRLFNLLATMTQGDLPLKWTLRPSLGAPDTKRSVTFADNDYRAWVASWQAYYKGGPKPTMPLVPGTNSPDPDPSINVVVNPVLTQPAPTPANPNPAPVPVAPAVAPVTVGAVTPAAANTIAAATNAVHPCTSTRKIKVVWAKGTQSGALIYRGKTIRAKKSNGRFRATIDVSGMVANGADYMKVTQVTKRNGHTRRVVRNFKVC